MAEPIHPVQVSPEALKRVVGLGLSGAPLNTFLALLAHLDQTGYARITQPELCRLLDTGPGRVWQNLQALVAAEVIDPPTVNAGKGRRTPYRIPASVAVAPMVPTPPRRSRAVSTLAQRAVAANRGPITNRPTLLPDDWMFRKGS